MEEKKPLQMIAELVSDIPICKMLGQETKISVLLETHGFLKRKIEDGEQFYITTQ